MAIVLPFVFISCNDDKDEPVADDHEYVDLGLPSGTLWATCNVGANTPEEFGDYFAWGETTPKDFYDWSNYRWGHWKWDTISDHFYHVEVTWYKYYSENRTNSGSVDGDRKTELDPEDDAAYVNWGSRWRMPTLEQFQELLDKCKWQWTKRNSAKGHLVTGPNGNSIFLPASGGYVDKLYNDNVCGYYWSRTRCSPDKLTLEASGQGDAYILFLDYSRNEVWYDSRYDGSTVRAVCVKKK